MNPSLIRPLIWLTASLALAGCVPKHAEVRPMQTVIDQAALEAGDLRIAASALQSGDLQVARSLYQDMARAHPDNQSVWMGLGDTYFLAGEFDSAGAAYAKAEAIDPTLMTPRLAQARLAVRMRKLDDARARFQAILAEEPDQSVALAGLGVVYDLSGQPALAQETYRKGLAAHPGDEALRTNLGLSLALQGKAREAINVLLGTDGVNNSLPQRRDNLALAYGLLGREDAAKNILLGTQPSGQVQDNLDFYRYLRDRVVQPGKSAG